MKRLLMVLLVGGLGWWVGAAWLKREATSGSGETAGGGRGGVAAGEAGALVGGAAEAGEVEASLVSVLQAAPVGAGEVGVDSPNPGLRPEPFYRRMRTATVDEGWSGEGLREAEGMVGRRVRFDLFPDAGWTGRVTRVERPGAGRVNLVGELEAMPGGDFIVALNAGGVAMSFTTPGAGRYQVRTAGDGLLTVIELEPELIPPCAHEPARDGVGARTPESRDARLRAALLTSHAADVNLPGSSYGASGQPGGTVEGLERSVVDVMIVHTAAAEAAAGGSAGVTALMDLMVARANATFINSRVGLQLRLVAAVPVDYEESGSFTTDLNRLTSTVDGHLDDVHALRNATGADLVTLLTEGPGGVGGGLAWLYQAGGGEAAYGFNVVNRAGCESTYIHEIGHNLGCEHDRDNTANDEDQALYPYAFGHRFTPAGYPQLRTVMAYAPGSRIPYFSNPDVTYLGTPTGVAVGEAGQAHNALVLENTKAVIAAHRATAGNVPPEIAFTYPREETALVARQGLTLEAEAEDVDGAVEVVRFYRLTSDDRWAFSNVISTALGSVSVAPYTWMIEAEPAGYTTFAAVAEDDAGGIAAEVVNVVINPWYRTERLPLPEGYEGPMRLWAINQAGQIAGTVNDGVNDRACRWDGATPVVLAPLPGDVASRGLGLAEDGTVYGESLDAGAVSRACRWTPAGEVVDLSEEVVGQTMAGALGEDEQGRRLLNTAVPRSYRDAVALPTNFRAQAIASSGLVGGYDYEFGPNAWRAARWEPGVGSTRVPPLAGYLSSWGWAINRTGAIAGISSPTAGGYSSSTSAATYWAAGSSTPVEIMPEGASASFATGINDHSEVVGYHSAGGVRPFYWRADTGPVPLREVLLPAPSLAPVYARAINHVGAIAVEAWTGTGYVPTRLVPVAGLSHGHWQRRQFSLAALEATGIAGDEEDPDGDGLPNLIERAFGLDPLVAETTLAATGYPELGYEEEAGRLTLTFRRLRAPTDMVYMVETSSDLAAESWSAAGAMEVSRVALDADWEEVVYQSVGEPPPGGRLFMRVRVGR